jgi:hypothetical protein
MQLEKQINIKTGLIQHLLLKAETALDTSFINYLAALIEAREREFIAEHDAKLESLLEGSQSLKK